MMRRYRPRRQFKFLLYQDVDMERILTDFILRLKGQRKFATAVKNGLRLIGSLQEHDLSVLFELFPWVEDAIRANTPTPPSAPDSGDLERFIQNAVQSSVQAIMMELPPPIPAPPMDYPAMKSNGTGKLHDRMTDQAVAMPTFEDDDQDDQDTIVLNKVSHENTGTNFQAGLASLGLFG